MGDPRRRAEPHAGQTRSCATSAATCDGVGAPRGLGGPARFGTALVPAYNDPGVTEHAGPPASALEHG